MHDRAQPIYSLPFKSVAISLLFTVFLGPVGLLYGSFIGGLMMIICIVAAFCARFLFIVLMLWMLCCVWGVKAVENYNKKLMSNR